MNWVDWAIVVTFLIYIAEGLRRGFFEQTMELIGFFITIFLALWTYQPLGNWLTNNVGLQKVAAEPIAFLIDWVILQSLYSIFLHLIYPMIPLKWRMNRPNHIAGIIPAWMKAFVIISILATMIVILPVPAKLKSEVNSSTLGSRFVAQSGRVEGYLNRIFGRDLKESLTFLTVPAQNEEVIGPNDRVDLKFTTEEVTVDRESEQKMLVLINDERAKVGLSLLLWDEELAEVARAQSKDMFKNGYFAHVNSTGQSPFDRMQAAGINFEAAGENLAYASNVNLAHNGLMRSPGHRANILESDLGRIGIGVIDGGIYGKMFTQNFTD